MKKTSVYLNKERQAALAEVGFPLLTVIDAGVAVLMEALRGETGAASVLARRGVAGMPPEQLHGHAAW